MDIEQAALNVHLITCRILRTIPIWLRRGIELSLVSLSIACFAVVASLHFQHVLLHHGSACFNSTVLDSDQIPDLVEITINPPQSSFLNSSAPISRFVFARERGLLQLSPATRLRLNVSSVTFTLHSDDACLLQSLDDFSVSSHSQSYLLGSYFNSWIQRAHPTVLTYLAGYDNVIANALHYRFVTGQMPELWLVDDDAVGYGVLLNLDTNEQRRLRKSNHVPLIAFMTRSWFVNASSTIPIGALISLIVFKADMIMSALLLVGSLTNMIGWILRESQSRMVQFTVDLQRSVQENQSVSRLVVSHLVACSAFIPFVIGIFMFMFAVFDNDHTIAFFFMVCMWLTEAFAMIYVRTLPSTTFYGGFAATYFFIFYGYFFTYPLGFHRLALWTCALLLLHGSVFFLMRFELPAAEILMTEELDNRDD